MRLDLRPNIIVYDAPRLEDEANYNTRVLVGTSVTRTIPDVVRQAIIWELDHPNRESKYDV